MVSIKYKLYEVQKSTHWKFSPLSYRSQIAFKFTIQKILLDSLRSISYERKLPREVALLSKVKKAKREKGDIITDFLHVGKFFSRDLELSMGYVNIKNHKGCDLLISWAPDQQLTASIDWRERSTVSSTNKHLLQDIENGR